MSKNLQETVSALENQAAESNDKLAQTLQELVYQIQPRTKANQLLAQAKYKAQEAAYVTMTTVDEAREGDRDAQMKLLKAAGVGLAVVSVCVLRRKLRRRNR